MIMDSFAVSPHSALQGFQLLVDDLSGFGSMAEQTLSQLQDDYPRCPVFAFPIRSYPPLQVELLTLIPSFLSLREETVP